MSEDDCFDRTEPGTRRARERQISSQQEFDAVELLLGQLDALDPHEDDEGRRKLVRDAFQKAFDRGQAMAQIAAADDAIGLAREKRARSQREAQILDINSALMAYERDQVPDAYRRLRHAIAVAAGPLPRTKKKATST